MMTRSTPPHSAHRPIMCVSRAQPFVRHRAGEVCGRPNSGAWPPRTGCRPNTNTDAAAAHHDQAYIVGTALSSAAGKSAAAAGCLWEGCAPPPGGTSQAGASCPKIKLMCCAVWRTHTNTTHLSIHASLSSKGRSAERCGALWKAVPHRARRPG